MTKNELRSNAGKIFQLVKALSEAVEDAGGSDADFDKIETDRELKRKIGELIVGVKKTVSRFKVFKTIKLGNGLETADDFRRALNKDGFRIGDWANDILGQRAFRAATEATQVDLVVVTVADLGFPDGATRQQIYNRAQKLGLKLCPPEVGPQLRLQYRDQPMDEWLYIGMEPITDPGGGLGVFGVGRDGYGRWLCGFYGHPDFWGGSRRWVFVLRK